MVSAIHKPVVIQDMAAACSAECRP